MHCCTYTSGLSTWSSGHGPYLVNPVSEFILKRASHLDAFSAYPTRRSLNSHALGRTTVTRRSEPSSRTALMGEQPNPWDRLQPQDATSRHRGAKLPRRYGLLGEISLLSPAYLLSVERRRFHKQPPDHYALLSYLLDL